MSFDDPSQSFSFQHQNPTRQATQRQYQYLQNCTDVWSQLKFLRKELKNKVNRSEFLTSLSGKLSISELSSMPTLTFRNKENMSTNHNQQQKCQANTDRWRQQWQNDIERNIKQIRNDISHVRCLYNEGDIDKIEETSKFKQKIIGIREQISELEAYTYSKADRSQIDKLFNLNELLVIQIEQAKQHTQDLAKQLKSYISENEKTTKNTNQFYITRQQSLTHQLRDQMNVFKQEIDRIMDVLQLREAQTQTYRAKENQSLIRCEADITFLKQKVKKYQLQYSLQIRDVMTRMSVVQLKESQVSRAAKQVDAMKNQIDTLRLDIHTVSEKVENNSDRSQKNYQRMIKEQKQVILNKMEKQLQITCEQIMRKVIQLTDSFVLSTENQKQLNNINKTTQKVYELSLSNSNCIEELNRQINKISQNYEQEIEKTEERLSKINTEMQQMISTKKMKEIMRDLVSCEELTHIAKEIDKKISGQMKKVVDQQLKVNEVLCSETIVAKWFWSSGFFKGGNLVTWDKQVVNTLPQNFKWVQGEPTVHISSSGYYQIQMGFYSKKKPTVQLIVNGQTIVSAVNSSSYVVHHSSGKLKDVSNSQISGLTFVDYLLLPDNARIGVSYIGQFTGEGFLCLKRL